MGCGLEKNGGQEFMRDYGYKFDVEDGVTILAIDHVGTVDAVMSSIRGNEYRIVWWNNGERYTEWMYERELS
jgi:hypothetical protein